MAKFKVSSLTVDYYEEDVEAANAEEAKEKFEEKLEEGELQPKEGYIFHDSDEEFEIIDGVVRIEDNDLDEEDDEKEFDDDSDDENDEEEIIVEVD